MSTLRREQALVFKARANPQVYAFTAQLIMYVLKDSTDWPKSVAKVLNDMYKVYHSSVCFCVHVCVLCCPCVRNSMYM